MLKRELFLAAMKAGLYKKVDWIISAFALTREAPDAWQKDPYPYRLVATPTGNFYVDPDTKELVMIEDSLPMQAVYRFKEKLVIQSTDGVTGLGYARSNPQVVSSYGNCLFNFIVIIHSFGGKMEYDNGDPTTGIIKVGKIEERILERLADDPKPGEAKPAEDGQYVGGLMGQPIYMSEYLKFAEGMFFMTNFTQLCTYGATKKVLLPPPGIENFKAQLLEAHKDKLDDKATIAKIDAALIDFDAQYLKGDPAENFLIDDKSRKTVRRKLFLMTGAETGLDENTVKATLIQNSLHQGWDITKFPEMNNSLRAGSFDRGSQTQLGGVSVKWLLRASSNMNVTADDCGSRMGNVTLVTAANMHKLVGFSMITQEGSKRIKTRDEAGIYLGKRLMMRSPMYCWLGKTDFCKVCVGERLTVNPDGLSIAVADYGNTFLAIYMKSMHGKNLALATMDLETAIF